VFLRLRGLDDPSLDLPGVLGVLWGLPVAPRMLLSDSQWRAEHVLAAWIAVEHARLTGAADSRTTTGYVNQVVDNSRLLSGGNPRLHLNLLRSQVHWLRGLPVGASVGLR
jgi:hypothetical protein